MKSKSLRVVTLTLAGLGAALQVGCWGPKDEAKRQLPASDAVVFVRAACYVTTMSDGPESANTVTGSDSLVCVKLVGNADNPGDTTDVEKKK
jgi:hypothetical protein